MSTAGLQNRPTWGVNRSVFPWVHFRAMIGELMLGRRERFEGLLGQVLANGCYASDFCMLPEFISRLGGWHNMPGYLTEMGALLQTVNLMLLDGDGRSVRVFPGVPEAWLEQRIAFRLRTSRGVLVDLCSDPGQGVRMEIESARAITILVRKPVVAIGALRDEVEEKVQDGYVRIQVSAGSTHTRITWKLR